MWGQKINSNTYLNSKSHLAGYHIISTSLLTSLSMLRSFLGGDHISAGPPDSNHHLPSYLSQLFPKQWSDKYICSHQLKLDEWPITLFLAVPCTGFPRPFYPSSILHQLIRQLSLINHRLYPKNTQHFAQHLAVPGEPCASYLPDVGNLWIQAMIYKRKLTDELMKDG